MRLRILLLQLNDVRRVFPGFVNVALIVSDLNNQFSAFGTDAAANDPLPLNLDARGEMRVGMRFRRLPAFEGNRCHYAEVMPATTLLPPTADFCGDCLHGIRN